MATKHTRGTGRSEPSPSSTSAPSPIHALCRQLLANGHLPLSRRAPSAPVSRPLGANMVALPWSGSANTARAAASSM